MEPSKPQAEAPDKEAAWESLTPPEQNRQNWQAVVQWWQKTRAVLFHPSRLWLQLTTWTVVGVIVVLVIGIGVGVMSMAPPEFFTARVCFILSAIILLIKLVHWLVTSAATNVERIALSVVCGGGIILALVLSLVWVQRRQLVRVESNAAVTNQTGEIVKGLGEKYAPQALLKKYPLGYVIFDLDYTNSVVPHDSHLPSEYKLDWAVVGFTSITQDRYELRLPDIYTKEGKPVMIGVTTKCKKQVGGWQGGASNGGSDVLMWSEILAITDKGIVFLIGFEHVPGLNSSK